MELESWSQEVPHDSSSGMNWTAAGIAELGSSLTERTKMGHEMGCPFQPHHLWRRTSNSSEPVTTDDAQ